jgi:hypothetical protein
VIFLSLYLSRISPKNAKNLLRIMLGRNSRRRTIFIGLVLSSLHGRKTPKRGSEAEILFYAKNIFV